MNQREDNGRIGDGMRLKSKMILTLLVLILITACTACSRTSKVNKITIAEQYGLAYAPLQVMKEMRLMEKNLPGVKVEWRQLGNTAAIREAMLVNEVDAGFMAIPPFLLGWDKGMDWKIATGLSSSPVGLVVSRPDIQSIKDFGKNDRIAVPQPGSVQHILLSMACEREFGNAHQLDDLLVTLAHPDGMNALIARKEVVAHFTSPPYLIKELEQKEMKLILSGEEAMGRDFTFIVGVTTSEFYNKNSNTYTAFIKSIDEAINFVNDHPQKAADILSKTYDLPEEEVLQQISWKGTQYSQVVKGIHEFAQFMKRNGYISKTPVDYNDILWKDVKYE